MSQQQQQRPVTFGDVLPVSGTLAAQPITKEDAALMQRTEAVTFGQTQKGGTAASLQSAADQNVQFGAVPSDAPTSVANEGVTYGDVLAVSGALHKTPPVTKEDATAMQSVETRTLGYTQKGGIAASMQSLADKSAQGSAVPDGNHSSSNGAKFATPEGVISVTGAPATQPVTKADAAHMQRAEMQSVGYIQKGGIAAKLQSAADKNLQAGAIHENTRSFVAPDKGITHGDALSTVGTQPITKDDAALMQRLGTRTLGHTEKGGIAATMRSAADKREQSHAIPDESVTSGKVAIPDGRVTGSKASVAAAAVRFGDIFPVEGTLADQPITKEDAALMQRAENFALGRIQKGGAAASMQSAADYNVQTGAIPRDAPSSIGEKSGITVVTTILPKDTKLTQFVLAGQPIPSSPLPAVGIAQTANEPQDAVTIGEALEAAAMRGGDEPIETRDASAIQCAEKRATRGDPTKPGSLAATAQAAAVLNPRVEEFAKTTLSDVLMDASARLPKDKVVTWEDAEKVAEAELRNNPHDEIRATGVAAALVTAAELNERAKISS